MEALEGTIVGQDFNEKSPSFPFVSWRVVVPLLGPGVAGLRVSALLFGFGESCGIEAIVRCL